MIYVSLSVVAFACSIQALGKYEMDFAILNFPEVNTRQQFALIDSIFTFIGGMANWLFLIIMSHLALMVFGYEGPLFRYLILSGFGYTLMAISNAISYFHSSSLYSLIEGYISNSTSQDNLQEMLWNTPYYKLIFLQSRISELLFLVWCSFLSHLLYKSSLRISLSASIIPAVLIYLIGMAFSKLFMG